MATNVILDDEETVQTPRERPVIFKEEGMHYSAGPLYYFGLHAKQVTFEHYTLKAL